MTHHRERGSARFHGVLAAAAMLTLAAGGYAAHAATAKHIRHRTATVTSLTFKETSVAGGDSNPVHLEIAFTGSPDAGDVVRIRPEKNDATGWSTAEPKKIPVPKPGDDAKHVAFNNKDDTGPYIDVPLTGTSPVKVTIETANPDADRADTVVTGKLGTADGVDSNKITITHSAK